MIPCWGMKESYTKFLKDSAGRRKWIRREFSVLKNMAAVARKFGISRERVRQIVNGK